MKRHKRVMIYSRTTSIAFIAIFFLVKIYAQQDNSKKGGIGFRVDDNQSIANWQQYASIFYKYNYSFTFALNVAEFTSNADYVKMVKSFQQAGFELGDHTPNHITTYFTTSKAEDYRGLPGVDHISGNMVALKYDSFDTTKTYYGDGFADLKNNMLISKNNGAFKNFTTVDPIYAAIYLPSKQMIVSFSDFSNSDTTNVDTLYLTTFWGEQIHFSDTSNIAIKIIGIYDIRMNTDALSLLARCSLDYYSQLGITRPVTWIQPGGAWPQLNAQETKNAFGVANSYTSAGVYLNPGLKCYNEYDPNGDRRYAMGWGDFTEDVSSLDQVKQTIADKIAKHYCAIGHSHFSSLLGGWNGYLTRMDSLLSWCKNKNVMVKTYREWADQLYSTPQNPYTNIFPLLDVDLDGNKVPDGYYAQTGYTDGTLDTIDGTANHGYYSYTINKKGSICFINQLAGIEKGDNDFYIYTKGSPGDSITVTFTFPANNYQAVTLKFPATSSSWNRYGVSQSVNGTTSLSIPIDVSYLSIRVSCSNYASGTIKVSGFELRKKINEPLKIISKPDTVAYAGSQYQYQLLVASQYYQDTLRYEKIEMPAWLNLTQDGTLRGTVPVDTGRYIVKLRVLDQHNNSDVQTFYIQITPKKSSIRIVSIPDTLIAPQMNYQYKIIAYSGYFTDTLNYSIQEAPDWLKINSSGILFGKAPNVIKAYRVDVAVTNQRGERTDQFFNISVQPIIIDSFEYDDSPLNHGWMVEQGIGTIKIQYDTLLKSRVLSSQTNQGTGFRIDHAGSWYSPTFSVQLRTDSNFILYVRILDSASNIVTMQYTPDDGQPSKSSDYCFFHIGTKYKGGTWNLIARDLNSDLVSAKWGSSFGSISSFMIRGSFFIDDLTVGTIITQNLTDTGKNPSNIATFYQLQQNYPNPFNPTTTIKYSIVSQSRVNLSIFNLLGQRIKTLEDGVVHENGFYLEVWNGEDERGRKISSGIYFYRLEAKPMHGDHPYIAVGKMLLLK